jgi:hypothetical protein
MPFAANGRISQEAMAEGVEITDEQYSEALEAMMAGRIVTIEDGFQIVDPPEPSPPEPETPPDPSPIYRLYKSAFIRRLTSEEAETMEGVLAQADAKLRLMFNSVEYFVSDDPLFETLLAAVGAALGEGRADQLLAEETP